MEIIILGISSLLTILLSVYLFIFAYYNPDPDNCWVADQVNTAALSRKDAIASAKAHGPYPMDMHRVFSIWFTWGFWANAVFIGALIVSSVLVSLKVKANALIATSVVAYNMNLIVWLVIGYTWRYSFAGRVASGDKLVRPKDITDAQWNQELET